MQDSRLHPRVQRAEITAAGARCAAAFPRYRQAKTLARLPLIEALMTQIHTFITLLPCTPCRMESLLT